MSLPQPPQSPQPSTSGPTTTPATGATIPTLDPHQETKPDYTKPEFADDRAYMASLHVPEDKIIEALSAMWDKAHGDRIKVWDEAIQKNSSTTGQPQPEVSGNPTTGPTGMTNAQQDVPPNTPTPRAVPIYSASASRSFSANQGSYPVDPMGPNKITYVVLDRSRPRPTDNLPPFANIVYVSMQTPGAYLPLFYLTAEGRCKADQKRLNTSATYDLATGRPHRPQELKEEECKRDAELTLDQIREAGVQFCDFVERNRWGGPDHEGEPDPVGLMFFDFFYNIDQHPFRNLTGDGEFGPQALALYAENTRKRWHMDINRGKPIYPIEEVKEDALKGCQDLLIKEERQQLLIEMRQLAKEQASRASARSPSPSAPSPSKRPKLSKRGGSTSLSFRSNASGTSQALCVVCLGTHQHDLYKCDADFFFGTNERTFARRNAQKELVTRAGNKQLCPAFQLRGCSGKHNGKISHQCSICGSNDHGALADPRATAIVAAHSA